MVTIPLGVQAYNRKYAGEPEVKLINRFLEQNPTNLVEHVSLLTRPGSNKLTSFSSGGLVGGSRSLWSKKGVFNGDLFGVSGPNLYRYSSDGTLIAISGLINGTGYVDAAWMKGIGYQYLFLSDGLLLQYYAGGTYARGTLTRSGTIDTTYKIAIGGIYYAWNDAVNTNSPAGTSANPWLAKLTGDPLVNMANLINFNGVRGTDFSTALGGPSPTFSAKTSGGPPTTALIITATSDRTDGNAIATSVVSGAGVSWGGATLTGGGTHALSGVTMPNGSPAKALASLNGYVLVSVGGSQQFFWLNPGSVTIDPLNFAEKESNPDNILNMVTVGDQVIICGEGSTENWYTTGNLAAPFAPIEGRVYRRGVVDGTPVPVKDNVMIVGDDGIVYAIGYAFGQETRYGVHRVSTHAIEERIRSQLRREQGLSQ